MADSIVIVGAGGFGRETLDVIAAINAAARDTVWDVFGVVKPLGDERRRSFPPRLVWGSLEEHLRAQLANHGRTKKQTG